MKWFGRILLACAVFAVLLLGGHTLIVGPEEDAEAAAETAAPVSTAIAVAEQAPLLPQLPEDPQVQRERAEIVQTETLPQIVSDRNGQPIASLVWFKTVYQACAPESVPG